MYFDYEYEKLLESITLKDQNQSLYSLITEGLKTVLSPNDSNFVYLSYGKWTHHNFGQVCPQIKDWKIKSLEANKNDQMKILHQLKEIGFPELREINLNENKIQSIQVMNRMQLPALKELWLDNNEIISIKELSKLKRRLKILSLNNNRIKDFETFPLFLTEELEELSLEYLPEDKQIQNIYYLFKIHSKKNKFFQLDINSKTRIQNLPGIEFLPEKFSFSFIQFSC